jgi:two-component system, NarL family, nitrate/nitrite response regulator NarL
MTRQRIPLPAGLPAAASRTRVGVQSIDRLRRESLAAYLETLAEFQVIGRVARYEDAVSLCALEQPGIILLDAGRDAGDAIAGCRLLRDRCPEVALALIYDRLSPDEIGDLQAGGLGALVPYAHGLDAVVTVLRQLATGTPAAYATSAAGLSRRQREILLLLASGHSATEIGDLLRISPGTVENHKRRVYAKLSAASAVQAVARAASFGIIDGRATNNHPRPVPTPAPAEASQPPPTDAGRVLVAVATGTPGETLDRVVATLIAAGIAVVRDAEPSWADLEPGLRWHRGPVVRVLVDPQADHWRVAAAPWRRTVVVFGQEPATSTAGETFASGAAAVLQPDHIEDQLVPLLALVTHGYVVMDDDLARPVVRTIGLRPGERGLEKPALTAREYDILNSIGRSLSVRQTARSLGIAVKTVENTQSHLFRKLGVHNRVEALSAAYSLGLLRPDSSDAVNRIE